MKDMMVDLETLGTVPGCSILSIGAVRFDPRTGEMGDEFYVAVSRLSCKEAGLHESASTVKWWESQSPEARKVLDEAASTAKSFGLSTALAAFNSYIQTVVGTRMWGNGADFDNALLRCAYHAVSLSPKLAPYNGRCYRTVKNLAPHIKLDKRQGTFHNALDDAKSQAQHLMDIVQQTTLTLA